MNLLLLLGTSILLAAGMVLLPPLTGAGLGSFVARAWLIFGLLVFSGHYLHYLEKGERARRFRNAAKPRVHLRSVRRGERSVEYK